MAQAVLDALVAKFGERIVRTSSDFGDEQVWVARQDLLEIAAFLRDDPAMAFDAPVAVTAIDRLGLDPEGAAPRFEVVWMLRSSAHLHRVRVKVAVDGDEPVVPSLTPLWRGFNWTERECYDMYGVRFQHHPDLRRIYMYEEFVGHPLRKDYPKEKRQPLVRRGDLE